jgi:hypothetical protein
MSKNSDPSSGSWALGDLTSAVLSAKRPGIEAAVVPCSKY